jgi:hypothetical protein
MTPEVSVWLTVDFTAKRYGVLPSQLIREGDTLDLDCAEIAVAYEQFVMKNPGTKTNHGVSQEDLMRAMQNAKSKKTSQQTK